MSSLGIIQDGSLADMLRKRLNTQPGFDTVAPELLPVFIVQDDALDQQFLKGVKLCAAAGEVGAVAGQIGFFSLLNPAGSNVIIEVEHVRWSYDQGRTFCAWFLDVAATGGGITETARDSRWMRGTVSGRPRGIANAGTQVGPFSAADLIAEYNQLVGIESEISDSPGLIMRPGSLLRWSLETANVQIDTFMLRWRERPVNPSELV